MTKDEFKEFYALLIELFPFVCKNPEDVKEWYAAMKDIPLNSALAQLRISRKSEDIMPVKLRRDPTPKDIAEDALKYGGMPSLMWIALQRRG